MKPERARIVKILGSLCCLGILIGLFLPMYTILGQSLTLLDCMEVVETFSKSAMDGLIIFMCVSAFLYLFTFLAVSAHGDSCGAGTSVILFLLTLGDWFLYKKVDETFFGLSFASLIKGVGAHLIGWCFMGLLLCGILSLLFAIMGKGSEQEVIQQSTQIQYVPQERVTRLVCPECGKPYEKGDTFCGRCGYHFKKFTCPSCGKEGDEGDRFCKKCGIHLVEVWKMNESEQKEEPVVEEQLVTCITCGEKMPITNRFCIRCGTMVNEQK